MRWHKDMYRVSPTKAREEFYDLLKFVNHHSEPVVISSSNNEDNAVIMSLKEWESIKETLYLHAAGTIDIINAREKDQSPYIDVDDIDSDKL